MAGFDGNVGAGSLAVDADMSNRFPADGYETLLVAFADHADIADIGVEAGDAEVDEFADAETAAVHGFEDGLVAVAFGFAVVDLRDDLFDLVEAQDIGKRAF